MTWPYLPGPLSHAYRQYRSTGCCRLPSDNQSGLAGQLAATGREILQVIIPGVREASQEVSSRACRKACWRVRCPHSLFHLPVMTGQGLKFRTSSRDPFSSAFVSSSCAASVFFPGADFPGTYSFRSYPQNCG